MSGLNYERLRRERAVRVGGAVLTHRRPDEAALLAAKAKVFLRVPFRRNVEAKRLGARWSIEAKRWYCLANSPAAGALLARFRVARPKKQRPAKPDALRAVAVPAAFAASLTDWLLASSDVASGRVVE